MLDSFASVFNFLFYFKEITTTSLDDSYGKVLFKNKVWSLVCASIYLKEYIDPE